MAHDLLEQQCAEKTVHGAHCEAPGRNTVACIGECGAKASRGNRLSKVIH
ncbi:hypothetical protein BamMEX5DRAFT_3343 [Burkholderia ambifaria MEX-5]|uniref:Uncharacterized protein n=1 Tax=Burkholderia ambifaria MEX-5 TaxID=396597 RepID=B1T6C7_9BURK|nr:hypothetical protein BamMEX5DRAFT_3343 [Burkholderia ambifaria MEX-5]